MSYGSLRSRRGIQSAILATTALCTVGRALADQPDAPATETITVTANKRAEKIQTVPLSVTAVREQLIDQVQATSLSDVSAYVPGLTVQSSGVDANRLIIRGLTTGSQDISPSVGVYVDDVPFGSNSGFALGALFSPDLDPFDLDHIEVLRGPQGTLYGASTLAGLVKYVTKAPDPNNYDAHVQVQGAEVDDTGAVSDTLRFGFNAPLVADKLALRVSGFDAHSEGDTTNVRTGEHDLNGSDRQGGRADLLLKPIDNLTIDLIGMYQASDTPHVGLVTGNAVTLQPTYGKNAGVDYVDGFARSNYYLFEGNVHYQFENGITATSATSLSRFAAQELADDTTTFGPAFGPVLGHLLAFGGAVDPTTKKFTQEFRLASPSNDHFEWLAGLFYDRETSDYLSSVTSSYLPGGTPPAVLAPTLAALANYETIDATSRYIEGAGFGNATYYILPDWDISGGVRYSRNDQHLTTAGTGLLALEGVIPSLARASSSDSVVTESFGTRWRFTDDDMVYARIARGYRPGGPNITSASFDPDTTWNYEVGVKGTALNNRLTADIAAFYIDWQKIQLNFFNGTNTITGNAGNARSEGIEFEGSYVPISGLTLDLNGAYTDAAITSLIPGATGGAAVGDALPYSAKWSATFRATFAFPLTSQVDASVGGDVRYKSSFTTAFPGDTGTRSYTLPSTTFLDLRSGIEFKNYSLDFQILNVADDRKLTAATETLAVSRAAADAFGQPVDLTYAAGRTFGLSLTARF